jgi:hypothetical protein
MIGGSDVDAFLAGACAGVILHRLRVVWVPHGLPRRVRGWLRVLER